MPKAPVRILVLPILALTASCGGGTGASPPPSPPTVAPTPTPTPTPTPADKWASVKAEMNASSIADMALIVGTPSGGVRVRYEKGSFRLTNQHLVASATKMMAGLTILKMVEQGQMSLNDNPQKYLPYWTTSATDPRSRVTLGQLLAFTSGFNSSETGIDCVNNPDTTLQLCAQEYYNKGVSTTPGAAFVYTNSHLQIAGAMAEIAGGKPFSQLFRDKVGDPLGLSAASGITTPSANNPRVAGGGVSTGEDYAKILAGVMSGNVLNDLTNFKRDQTVGVSFIFRPPAVTDWHYAAASWRECDTTPFATNCSNVFTISSPGKFGWTPWIDFDSGYYAVLTMQGPLDQDTSPASVALEQRLQPLIAAALANGG